MTAQEKILFSEEALITINTFGIPGALKKKQDEIIRKSAIATLEKVLSDLKDGKDLSKYSWIQSPAGNKYGKDNELLNITPDLSVQFGLEYFNQ